MKQLQRPHSQVCDFLNWMVFLLNCYWKETLWNCTVITNTLKIVPRMSFFPMSLFFLCIFLVKPSKDVSCVFLKFKSHISKLLWQEPHPVPYILGVSHQDIYWQVSSMKLLCMKMLNDVSFDVTSNNQGSVTCFVSREGINGLVKSVNTKGPLTVETYSCSCMSSIYCRFLRRRFEAWRLKKTATKQNHPDLSNVTKPGSNSVE